MPVSDADEKRVVTLQSRDVASTLGAGYEELVGSAAARMREFEEHLDLYEYRVVEDVQQHFHDCFIDTTWPACPRHPNHPMWFHEDGYWHAHGKPVAKLGELRSSR